MAVPPKGPAPRGRGSESPDKAAQTALFAASGEYWTLAFAGATFPLKDFKGLSYIQRLLEHPGQEFHALDLLSGPGVATAAVSDEPKLRTEGNDEVEGLGDTAEMVDAWSKRAQPEGSDSVGGLGDAGPMLDPQAKQSYRRAIVELEEELEDLRERGKRERADEVESKLAFLKRELVRGVGLGGRDRRAGSAAERARLNVTRAIKNALEKISEQHAALSELLDRTIKTGSFCSYLPDPQSPVVWHFSPEGAKPAAEVPQEGPSISRDISFLRAFTEGTVFVGREAERAELLRTLEQARRREGKIVLIGGAAGVGKTRIAAEIAAEASRCGMLTFVGSCYDRHDPVPFIPFVEILEGALAQTRDLAAFRRTLGGDASELARLVPQLRRSFPDIPAPIELPPEQSRRYLFGAVRELVTRVSDDTPALILLDDLQWADEGTLLLLSYIAQFVPALPVMIVATYRDFEPDPAGHLTRTFDELIRRHLVERVMLNGLPRSAVAEMLRALSGREPPPAVVRIFHSDTDGNPFFVEELYKHLVEQGRLIDSAGAFQHDLIGNLEVPQNVRLVIGRRLALISEGTLKMLCTAAVIGRSFTFELLAAAMNAEPDSLLDCIEEAEIFGLISSAVQYPEARFRFSHELSRQAVISQISAARRQRIHLQIGTALENLHAGGLEEVAIEIAHHFQGAGTAADTTKTIRYLSMAGRSARLQGAFAESGEFYRSALTLLERIPDAPERDRLELSLQLGIGAALLATRGYADTETAGAYRRATILGERLGDPTQVVLAFTGLCSGTLLRGELDSAQVLADQALAASQRHGKSKTETWGHHIVGTVEYHRGHLTSAWNHLTRARELYLEEEHKKNPQDPGIELLEYMALTAWQLGKADVARARMHDAISFSERIKKPFGLARSSFYAAYLHVLLRDAEVAQHFAEKAIEYSTKYSIPLFLDASRMVYGWAVAQQGRCAEGAACTRTAVESYKAAGNLLGIGSYLGFLSEALLSAGSPEEAMTAVEQGFSLTPPQPMDISYLWGLKGALLLEQIGPGAAAQNHPSVNSRREDAEKSFRKSISVAQSVGAKSYEIRSATGLGRLLAASGRATEARAIVEPLLQSIREGLDTRDLKDAKQLMEQLL